MHRFLARRRNCSWDLNVAEFLSNRLTKDCTSSHKHLKCSDLFGRSLLFIQKTGEGRKEGCRLSAHFRDPEK